MTTDTQSGRMARVAWPLASPLGPMQMAPAPRSTALPPRAPAAQTDKHLADLSAAFDIFGISHGAVLSFHHHYRNGDRLINAVMAEAARRGLRGLTIAPSSLFPVHAPLAALIERGVIAHVVTDYAKGPVADAIMSGTLRSPAVLQSHGGRARALETGALKVDVAFIGASLARTDGACTGRGGEVPCGPLGYAMVDAAYARHSVICAHEIVDGPLPHIDIPAAHVDALLHFPHPGAVSGIASDTTLPAQTPQAQQIGSMVAQVIAAADLMQNGMSLQTGAGGYSLSSVPLIGTAMAQAGVRGSFISGGITGAHVALHRAGLFACLHDVQCFDTEAVASSIANPDHYAMSAARYASPLDPRAVVEGLSVMVLGAVEIDRQFNVNVTIGGDGRLIGGPGGHPDAAQGADLTVVTTGLTAGGYSKLVEHARCVTTAGAGVDVLVSDHGIAVHPDRPALETALKNRGLPVTTFDALMARAQKEALKTRCAPSPTPCLLLEDRAGGVLDWS